MRRSLVPTSNTEVSAYASNPTNLVLDLFGYFAPQVVSITNLSLPNGQAGSLYSQQLSASGGAGPYAWSASALPPGLTLSSSGQLSGYPAVAGSLSATIYATDQNGHSASTILTFSTAANSSTIAGPSSLQMNLSYMPFLSYNTSAPASTLFPASCPSGASVEGCFQTVLGDLRAQGVSGVRIFVGLCDALAGCGQLTSNIFYIGGSLCPPPYTGSSWICGATRFFQDVKNAGIQNVTITLPAAGEQASLPKSSTVTPLGSDPNTSYCVDTQSTVYFDPAEPWGEKLVQVPDPNHMGQYLNRYYPIGEDEAGSNGYNCAPVNPYFEGWPNIFAAVGAMLQAAASAGITVYELEPEQEMNLIDFPVYARHISDNSTSPPTDVMAGFQQLMTANGFSAGRVAYSATYDNSTLASYNCINVFSDWARNLDADEMAAAIAGGSYIGRPNVLNLNGNDQPTGTYPYTDGVGQSTGSLWCGGDVSTMMAGMLTYSHAQPTLVDIHTYPGIGPIPFPSNNDAADAVQGEGAIDFSNLSHYYQLLGLPSTTTFLVGETHSYTNNGGGTCEANGPLTAAAETVAAYNQSTFPASGVPVVFRPWMQLEGTMMAPSCNTYTPNNQSANPQGMGPYTPTQP